jgi:small-conductance mechanosensitive channel
MIGIVQHIGLRTTTLLTRDDTVVRVPNSTFINENIENYTDEVVETRFDIKIGVAYGSDIELVMKILKECAVEHPKVEKTPEPVVLFSDFGDWALKFTLYFWTFENFRFEGIKSDIRIAINREFLKHDIKIPVPQSDVRVLT